MILPWPPEAAVQRLPTPGEIERALSEVFARPELAPPSPGPLARLSRQVWEAVTGLFRRLFGSVELPSGTGGVVFTVVLIALGAVALAVLGWTVWGLVRRRRSRRRRVRAREATASPEAGPTASGWEERARAAAAAGRWRDAAVALYHALLLRLQDRGALEYDRAKTPGDYRGEAYGDPVLGRALDAFLVVFERAAYGASASDPDGYARLRAAAAELGVRG